MNVLRIAVTHWLSRIFGFALELGPFRAYCADGLGLHIGWFDKSRDCWTWKLSL